MTSISLELHLEEAQIVSGNQQFRETSRPGFDPGVLLSRQLSRLVRIFMFKAQDFERWDLERLESAGDARRRANQPDQQL